jgi:hypothetical protein
LECGNLFPLFLFFGGNLLPHFVAFGVRCGQDAFIIDAGNRKKKSGNTFFPHI